MSGGDAFGLAGLHHAQVHFEAGLVWDDIGRNPAADHADVERGAFAVVSQFLDGEHLMGHFFDGVAAFFVVATGVGGPSLHPDGEIAHAFAPGLNRPVRHAGFEHQYQGGFSGQFFDQSPGCPAADFFVRGEQGGNGVGQAFRSRAAAAMAVSATTMPPFMSDTPGPKTLPSFSWKGIFASVPTGKTVSMWREQENAFLNLCPIVGEGHEIARTSVFTEWSADGLDLCSQAAAFLRNERADAVHGGFVVRRGFGLDQPFEQGEHVRACGL